MGLQEHKCCTHMLLISVAICLSLHAAPHSQPAAPGSLPPPPHQANPERDSFWSEHLELRKWGLVLFSGSAE